jgi:hypothetical protein
MVGTTEWPENRFVGVIWHEKFIKHIFRPEGRPWAAVVPVAGLVVPAAAVADGIASKEPLAIGDKYKN